MTSINGNIIRKQIIDVIVNAPVNGFEFQNQVESLYRLKLKTGLENLMLKYDSMEDVICIDLLFAEVEYNSLADFQNLFAEKILAEIEKQLDEKISYSYASNTDLNWSKADRLLNLLVFFLRKGFLPWWSTVKTSSDWQGQLNKLISEENRPADWTILYQSLKERGVRTRLLEILNQEQFWKLIESLTEVNTGSLRVDYEIILSTFKKAKEKHIFGQLYKDLLLNSISEARNGKILIDLFSNILINDIELKYPELLSVIIIDKINTPALRGSVVKAMRKPRNNALEIRAKKTISADNTKFVKNLPAERDFKQNSQTEKEEIYINNAGLVIVSAFLPMFFNDIRLISKAGVLDSNKAIAVMQYTVTGRDEYDEFEVVLPKILCGIEISDPISKYRLSRKEKHKVKDLLESVVEHWVALKNTSADGLRASFLQREGKLNFKNNNWNLKVKQEAYDMLISHIPWNISLIKLPWMKGMLNVEWT